MEKEYFISVALLFLATLVQTEGQEQTTPMLIFGKEVPEIDENHVITKQEFSDIINPILKTHAIIVYVEKYFEFDDMGKCLDETDLDTCFPHWITDHKTGFYNNVEDPTAVFKDLTKIQNYYADTKGECVIPKENLAPGHVSFVNYDLYNKANNISEVDPYPRLVLHDLVVKNVQSKITDIETMGIFMRKQSELKPTSVPDPQVGELPDRSAPFDIYEFGEVIFDPSGELFALQNDEYRLLFYFYRAHCNGSRVFLNKVDLKAGTSFDVDLYFGNENKMVNFQTTANLSTWNFKFTNTDYFITRSFNRSFHCYEYQYTNNDTNVDIMFEHLQIEVIKRETNTNSNPDSLRFHRAVECIDQPHMTIGILVSSCVAALLLVPLFLITIAFTNINSEFHTDIMTKGDILIENH